MSYLSSQLRSAFASFFVSQGHHHIASSPLVPSDPSLLFTSAGMVQFKDFFTGKQRPSHSRVVTVQKCVRAGGKHNDLDNVGRTARHHTFFEMLGNFSFGDYFKQDAIRFAWEFIHKQLSLPKDRLCFTFFSGEEGIPADEEAKKIWKQITGVGDEQIIGLGKKENFWMMGDTGPQGPCSEIHFFQGNDLPCLLEQNGQRCLGPACDCDRYLEIWNLVFMQFERKEAAGPLVPLPAPSIDTGAGLERLCSVVQNKRSNYDTDLFVPLIDKVSQSCGVKYRHSDIVTDVSMRILADHARATACLIADGVLPGNVGRGYVLRSIMRRAIRHAVKLKLEASFFADLCVDVTSLKYLGGVYPELITATSLINQTVLSEEDGFRATIDRGLKLLESNTNWLSAPTKEKTLPGVVAFTLHDTYGFPLELTQMIGQEQGFKVDVDGFSALMKEQKERSKFTGSGDKETNQIYHQLKQATGPTEFLGYGNEHFGCIGKGKILAIIDSKGELVDSLSQGFTGEIILDKTPFYGRSGGQIGDTGQMLGLHRGDVVRVEDTFKLLDDLIVHRVQVNLGMIQVGQEVCLEVDKNRRENIRKNHSATHLLHYTLRQLIGDHVVQKGSYVGPDKLTFDFTSGLPLDSDTLALVERGVNRAIWANFDQQMVQSGVEEAKKMGALALFGEKYAQQVRVVRLGDSVELCGGTHVNKTGDIGLFKIISESGVAKGIRRIEALTGQAAYDYSCQMEKDMCLLADMLKVHPSHVLEKVVALNENNKSKDKEIVQLKRTAFLTTNLDNSLRLEGVYHGEKIGVLFVKNVDLASLRDNFMEIRQKFHWMVLCVFSQESQKAHLVVSVDKKLLDKGFLPANILVQKIGSLFGAKGGGKPDLAQASGQPLSDINQTLQEALYLMNQTA